MGANASKDKIKEQSSLYKGLRGTAEVATRFASIINGINEKDENGETKIFNAIRSGDAEAVLGLLEHGADPNVVSNKGLTPCHEAVLNGNRDVILAILGAKNLDVKTRTKKEYQKGNVKLDKGSNLLHILTTRTEEDVVKLSEVLLCFVDEREQDVNNNTPCDVAKMAKHARLLATLESCAKIWKSRAQSARKERERCLQAQKDMLTEAEKQQIREHERYLIGMKIIPVMAYLFSNLVLCNYDRNWIITECDRDKEKAAKYIIEDVIITGPYSNLVHFRQALIDVRQETIAQFLPMRDEHTKL